MAHTKSGGSTKLGRDSRSKRLGIKRNHGERVLAGQILVRQRGTKYVPGENVSRAGDDTLYAARAGTVEFRIGRKIRFDSTRRVMTVVNIR